MVAQLQSIREQRYDQIYPILDPMEIERVRRFGNLRSFGAGELLWTVGEVAPGLMVILAGKVAVTERDRFDNHKPIAVHGPGNFLGELALLSGRPALVDAIAQEPRRGTHHPVGAAARADDCGSRTWRAHHARFDLAPRRYPAGGDRRTDHPWSRRERRCAAAGRFSPPQWSSPPTAQSRDRRTGKRTDRTFPHRSGTVADRAVPQRTTAAQSRRGRTGALPWFGAAD